MVARLQPVPQEPRLVYLDANATTPLLAEVFDAMTPWFISRTGNASSSHVHGRDAGEAVETARRRVAGLIGAETPEVVFTGGGTESDNLAIFGAVTEPGAHIVATSIEHHAVLHAVERLEHRGYTATYLPANGSGQIDAEDLRRALKPSTRLISVMMANNETGVLQPVEEVGRIARDRGILFHTDAVQAAGKVPIDVRKIGCDLLSISAHKMHGPQGVGALYVRSGVDLQPMFAGGNQERGLRAGTENVAGVVGFGKAAELAMNSIVDNGVGRIACLRDALERGILLAAGGAGVNGELARRVPNTTNIWFGGVDGPAFLHALDQLGLSASGGSACTAGRCEPSHVLLAMGVSFQKARASVRFGLSKLSTPDEVDLAIWRISEALGQIRSGSFGRFRPMLSRSSA
jgi:cysteine desulfurase